jgi:6-phosphogluconolactonase
VFEPGEGVLVALQSVSTLPDGFRGESLGGHIAITAAGDRVYVTNRGHDSIAMFALGEDGRLSLLGHTPSGGASPRYCVLLESQRRMLVANEEGHNLAIFEVGAEGALTQADAVAVPAPAFVFATTTF